MTPGREARDRAAAGAARRRHHRGRLPGRLARRLSRRCARSPRSVREAPTIAALARANERRHRQPPARALRGAPHAAHPHLPRHLRHPPRAPAAHDARARRSSRRSTRCGCARSARARRRVLGRGRRALRLRVPATRCCRRCIEAGATTLNIPDTVGYALPRRVRRADRAARRATCPASSAVISVHCHDDLGLAVANSLAGGAGRRAAGRVHDQRHRRARRQRLARRGRDGAQDAPRRSSASTTGVDTEQLTPHQPSCCRRPPASGRSRTRRSSARNAFAHEAGIHQDGVLKDPLTYEIMTPGERRRRARRSWCWASTPGARAASAPARRWASTLDDGASSRPSPRASRSWPTARRTSTTTTSWRSCAARAGAPRAARCATRSSPATSSCPPRRSRSRSTATRRSASAVGNGPVDAVFKAVDAALGVDRRAARVHTRAVTAGKDALAEVIVRVRHGEHESTGQAAEHRLHRGRASRPTCSGASARPARRAQAGGRREPTPPRTLFEKVWDAHVVRPADARTRRRCSTSTCTWSTRSPRRRPSPCCASAA